MTLRPPSLLVTVALFAALASPLTAQDSPSAVTAADPAIEVEHLELMLDPLTKDELAAEATAWRDNVKAKVQEMSEIQISASKEEDDDARGILNEKLAELQDNKSSALKRFESVLTEFEEKGGDAGEFRTYSKAVSGINVQNGDTSTKISVVRGWLTSEDGGIKWAIWSRQFRSHPHHLLDHRVHRFQHRPPHHGQAPQLVRPAGAFHQQARQARHPLHRPARRPFLSRRECQRDPRPYRRRSVHHRLRPAGHARELRRRA